MSRALVWMTATLAVAAGGCAGQRAAAARTRLLQEKLDELRYPRPLDEVWGEARRLLAEKGYPLAGQDAEAVGQKPAFLASIFSPAKETRPDPAGTQFLETGWGRGQLRYRLAAPVEGGSCRVVFTAIREDQTEHGRDAGPGTRDVDMELELARRLDPEAAARIEAALGTAPGS
jgi:hypothetical protein